MCRPLNDPFAFMDKGSAVNGMSTPESPGMDERAELLERAEALGELTAAVMAAYEQERTKKPAPDELERAKSLAAHNDEASRILIGQIRRGFLPQIASTDLQKIEGIGPGYAAKLAEAGVDSVEELLRAGSTPQGRRRLNQATAIASELILTWVNHADLFRIPGIGGEYAELLEAAGVDTVPELARRNPANLAAALSEVNAARRLVRKLPAAAEVERWITAAKTVRRAVKY